LNHLNGFGSPEPLNRLKARRLQGMNRLNGFDSQEALNYFKGWSHWRREPFIPGQAFIMFRDVE
jgi:hypothetical protein